MFSVVLAVVSAMLTTLAKHPREHYSVPQMLLLAAGDLVIALVAQKQLRIGKYADGMPKPWFGTNA